MEDQVRTLLVTFSENRKDCVKNLIAIPYGDRFPLEYIIVEVCVFVCVFSFSCVRRWLCVCGCGYGFRSVYPSVCTCALCFKSIAAS